MGSGCCKNQEVIPINLSKSFSKLIPGKSLESIKVSHSLSTEQFSAVSLINWKRGSQIGEGVFGKVYQVLNVDSGELLAVKTYPLSPFKELAEKQLMQISREIKILRQLNHTNIIKYFQIDYNEELNSVDILMEYIPSGSMNDLLSKYKGLSESAVSNYTRQLLEGIQYLHTNQILHRDLKSANILITEEGVLKITDFGCSRQFDDNTTGVSQSFKGSPYWMAPELVMRLGHKFPADIWALGCLVIEMISGKPPWSNYSNNSRQVLQMIAKKGSLPDLPQVSDYLKDFILKCLNREPELRPTASELLNHEFLVHGSVTRCYDSIRASGVGTFRSTL